MQRVDSGVALHRWIQFIQCWLCNACWHAAIYSVECCQDFDMSFEGWWTWWLHYKLLFGQYLLSAQVNRQASGHFTVKWTWMCATSWETLEEVSTYLICKVLHSWALSPKTNFYHQSHFKVTHLNWSSWVYQLLIYGQRLWYWCQVACVHVSSFTIKELITYEQSCTTRKSQTGDEDELFIHQMRGCYLWFSGSQSAPSSKSPDSHLSKELWHSKCYQ